MIFLIVFFCYDLFSIKLLLVTEKFGGKKVSQETFCVYSKYWKKIVHTYEGSEAVSQLFF